MKADLKTEIILTAQKLFAEEGYNSVSMRQIADTLGISVGNLTYHFPKKEVLIEAAVVQGHESHRILPPSKSIKELDDYFSYILQRQKDKAYYFRHYMQLAQICPKVYEMQVAMMQKAFVNMEQTIQNLEETGFIQKESFSGQYKSMLQGIQWILIQGMPFFERTEGDGSLAVRRCLWSVLYPCFTEKGRQAFFLLSFPDEYIDKEVVKE